MQRFTDLRVWQAAKVFAGLAYRATADFPAEERYGLTSQIRRAAVSISANIAEGAKRATGTDYARFLNMAEGSTAEVESLLRVATEAQLLSTEKLPSLVEPLQDIARMLHHLRRCVEAGLPSRRPR